MGRMANIRAVSLAVSALFLLACGDDEGLTGTPQPGQLTGSCLGGQCLPGLMCFIDKCQPGGGGTNANSGPPDDPTGGTSETTGVTEGHSTSPTTGEPPQTTTTTNVTGVTTQTTDPPDTTSFTDSGDDTGNFIRPETDTGEDTVGEMCGNFTCTPSQHCILFDGQPTCAQACDPLDGATCPFLEVCAWAESVFVCAQDVSGDGGAFGDPCSYANDCKPVLTCLQGQFVAGCQSTNCCSLFCDLDSTICEQFDMQCAPWYDQGTAPPGLEDLGVCII